MLNLLFDSKDINTANIKLIDFGFATKYQKNQKIKKYWGTLDYMPPQYYFGFPYDGPKTDVWALGIILFSFVAGGMPFGGENSQEKVKQGIFR